MKFTLSWLKKFLATEASLLEITDKLTMLGLEVEEVQDHSESLTNFQVAQIIETKPHPNADKLQICSVQTKQEILTIICGANNARAGLKVALAKIGAVIPAGGFKIKKSKIRGVESFGMLCSAQELGLESKDETGIMEIDDQVPVGESMISYLGFNDPIIHINVTPNRADALGVYGIARDLAAVGLGTLREVDIPVIKPQFTTNIAINTEISLGDDPNIVQLFSLLHIRNIKNSSSPKWLQNLLKNIDVTPVSLVVDVTNYISYSFGQPMHVYDAEQITGELTITSLKKQEKFTALNECEYELQPGDLVVKDQTQIQSLAGIIGASQSACNLDTRHILLEAACFQADQIAKTGRRLNIDSQARYRFERHVDSHFTLKALAIASEMIQEICGGEISQPIIKGEKKSAIEEIDFPINLLKKRTNIELATEQICNILKSLGFQVKDERDKLNITVPSWRRDVSIKEDIIEEIIRIYGYDKIIAEPLSIIPSKKLLSKDQKRLFDFKRLLAANGYQEVISWSFTDKQKAALFSDINPELELQNPISSELDYMRPSILPNLLKMVANNLNRSIDNLSIFEVGPVFISQQTPTINHATGVRLGAAIEKDSHGQARAYDIFDIKADISDLLAYADLNIDKCKIAPKAPSYYHPTRSANISLGKNILGYFGQLHPFILQKFAIKAEIYAFELIIDQLPLNKNKYGKKTRPNISNYQKITRDYAFILPKTQIIGELLQFIANIDRKLIKSVKLFDLYDGSKVDSSQQSVALSVTIQADDRTLTEIDIEQLHQKIINNVTVKFGGKLRDGSI